MSTLPERKSRETGIRAVRSTSGNRGGIFNPSSAARPYKPSFKDELADHYGVTLQKYLQESGEQSLEEAYEIGRQAISQGLCVTEMVGIHHDALVKVLIPLLLPDASGDSAPQRETSEATHPASASPQDRKRLVKAAEEFLAECLVPFEVTYLGYLEANEALRASKERYRELFENANDIIFTTDLLGNFISLNRVGEQMTGYSRDEVRRMNIGEVCAPDCQAAAFGMLDRRVMGEDAGPCELELLARDGKRIPVEISCQLVCRDGEPFGIQAIARDIAERKRAEESLRHLTEALEQEAKRIAHALHDEAGQLLASVHIALETVARDLPAEQGERVRGIQGLLDEIEHQLRRLSHELRPTILDDLGLVPAIEFLSQGISARTGVPIAIDGEELGRLPAPVEEVLYRVVQEALINASKHARATSISVIFNRREGELTCRIRDDGVGFDLRAALAGNGERGFGLINMRERLKFVGGSCVITSHPNQGTEVYVAVPVETNDAAQNLAG